MSKLTPSFFSDRTLTPYGISWRQSILPSYGELSFRQQRFTTTAVNFYKKKPIALKTRTLKYHNRTEGPVNSFGFESIRCTNDDRKKEKVIVIMGSTGSGKSQLAVDLAAAFSGEIINTDKLQFYKGLDITTNQMSVSERGGIPHHFLADLDPDDGELKAAEYRSMAARTISEIVSRGKMPVIAGGSKSYILALLSEHWEEDTKPFSGSWPIASDLRYDCCFLWTDVSFPTLNEYLSVRVDDMVRMGMLEELTEFYLAKKNPRESANLTALWKAIGVQEFEEYFLKYPPKINRNASAEKNEEWELERKEAFDKAIREIKENTYRLSRKQVERIQMLRKSGWDINRVDTTASVEEKLRARAEENRSVGNKWRQIWDKEVLEPCMKIVMSDLQLCLGSD